MEEIKNFLTKIATLYYVVGLSQKEIAEKYGITRVKVSRYLARAKNENIVEIKIKINKVDYSILEYKIEKKYNLRECIVVPSDEFFENIVRNIAEELSYLLNKTVRDGDFIGISWGKSLKSITELIEVKPKKNISIIPIIGGLGNIDVGIHTNSIANIIAKKFNGSNYIINCPAILDRISKENIEKDINITDILELGRNVDLAIVGLSDIGPESSLFKYGNLSQKDCEYLTNLGIVGDSNLFFLNEQGKHIKNEVDNRIITIPLNNLKKSRNTIAIGFGHRKITITLALLRSGLIDTLIADENNINEIINTF